MDKILKRDEFVKAVYEPLEEQKKYDELVAVNEGLLKTLFGMAKNLFKKDWDTIKGDPGIIKVYKELDDSLTGFSTMKLAKKGECNKIRQELVDFACDWYEMKMNKAKENDVDPTPARSMKFKNDTLRENLENVERKIKEIAGDDEQMLKWADTLKKDMKLVINRSIYEEVKDEETRKKLEKQNAEDARKQETINKEMEKFQNEQLKEIQQDRERLISDLEASPMKPDDLLGDKAIQNLSGEFDKIRKAKDNRTRLIQKDEVLGFKSIFKDVDFESAEFKKTYKMLDSFYTALNDNEVMQKFTETPGQSVQAMCIAVSAFVKNCVFGDTDYGKALPLMAKCAVISDGTVSYNLPLNGKEGDEAGNYFTDIVKIITDGKLKDSKGKEIKLPDNFKTSSKTLMNKIVSEAEKLKDDADKKYNERLKSLKLDEE